MKTSSLVAALGLSAVVGLATPLLASAQTQPGAVYTPGGGAAATGADFAGGVVTSRGVVATPAAPPQQGGYQQYQGGTVTSQGVVNNPQPASAPQGR